MRMSESRSAELGETKRGEEEGEEVGLSGV